MRVIKRNGEKEDVAFDKVLIRISHFSDGLNVDHCDISQKVISKIYDNVKTSELDELAARLCCDMVLDHPDYGILASRIIISNHHKNTSPSFSETISNLWNFCKDGKHTPLIDEKLYRTVSNNANKLNSRIKHDRDFQFDYFGFKTLERSYLLKIGDVIYERPQYMFMRVALGIHGDDIKDALETYDLMSQRFFVHATPTLYNAGTPRPQLSSCFLLAMESDSIRGIFNTLSECADISANAGGIGLHIHKIRSKGSVIKGTNGRSSGIVPMLKVFNSTAVYVDQAGRRPGAIAIYLEPWHADIESFVELRRQQGKEEERSRDLFYAIWLNDLFLNRIDRGEKWSLMDPNESQGLSEVWGDEFDRLYTKYEQEGRFVKQIEARDLWYQILKTIAETGIPYLLSKDNANAKSNQQNLGTIQSSNLCAEVIQYTSADEVSVCNLASICLPTFVEFDDIKNPRYNFDKLHHIAEVVTKNLNKVIDVNYYPVEKARTSNLRHRPIGIGVQGLADVFALMRIPFDSPEAAQLNRDIFETIYHGAVTSSMMIAKRREEVIKSGDCDYNLNLNNSEDTSNEYPGAYSSFVGSPASQGRLQFDLWGVTPSDRWDWNALKQNIKRWGIRNSLLVAPMPTASTSQIMGFNECTEPVTNNIYKRKTSSGEFILVNKYMVRDLIDLKIWNGETRNRIIMNGGSLADFDEIPQEIKNLYKTVWEIKMKVIIDMAADRGPYVCQSQSMNLWMREPDFSKMNGMYFYAWKRNLKTIQYYLRSDAKAKAQNFTIDPSKQKFANLKESKPNAKEIEQDTILTKQDPIENLVCKREEGCVSCQ